MDDAGLGDGGIGKKTRTHVCPHYEFSPTLSRQCGQELVGSQTYNQRLNGQAESRYSDGNGKSEHDGVGERKGAGDTHVFQVSMSPTDVDYAWSSASVSSAYSFRSSVLMCACPPLKQAERTTVCSERNVPDQSVRLSGILLGYRLEPTGLHDGDHGLAIIKTGSKNENEDTLSRMDYQPELAKI
ncbi:unnamed protein product [Protopolystoma xenopodis]|uniref:Uncharacterized protein n=1 Tax=Protopolystoma xenopodis TaxID=117903 RepID=A0A448XCM5_9PLAT|nr:unnamed protein product [Protopolystoma xenopodis]